MYGEREWVKVKEERKLRMRAEVAVSGSPTTTFSLTRYFVRYSIRVEFFFYFLK
jgi:hypothetical protein